MSVAKEIIDGWENYIFRTPTIEAMAKDRAEVCSKCEFLSTALKYYLYCKKCGCYIPGKTRSITSQCPLKKW